MGAQDERGVPVPFVGLFSFKRLRLDLGAFTAFLVVPEDVTILVSGIDYVGVARFDGLPEAVAAKCPYPFTA